MDHRLKVFFRLLLLLISASIFAGCLLTEYALTTKTDVIINPKLLGTWIIDQSSIDNSIVKVDIKDISVFSFNDSEYYLEWLNGEEEEPVRLRAYITIIDNVSFLNIQNIAEDEKTFLICKLVSTSDNTVGLSFIDDFLFQKRPSSSNEIYSVVRENLNNPKLYGMSIDLRRPGNKK